MLAYYVWYIEKEFNIRIDDNFPLMKFNNLTNQDNFDKYNKEQERQMKGGDKPKTFGGG